MATDPWARPTYFGSRYGTLCCIQLSKPSGTYIKNFTTYCGQLQLAYKDPSNGVTIQKGTKPRVLKGAVWYSRPTSAKTEPDSYSKSEYDMANYPAAPNNYPNYLGENFWKPLEFEFDVPSVDLSGTTCYCGFYTDIDSPNASSNFCFPKDPNATMIYNKKLTMTTWDRGFRIKANSLNPVPPYTKPQIGIKSNSTKICRYNDNATVYWTSSSGSSSNTYLNINGTKVNQNSGDNAGNFTFSPKTYGVSQGSSYNVTVYRNGPYGGGTTVSDSQTLYTYTEPTLDNLTRNIPIINANQSEKFTWNTNIPNWKGKTLETHTLKLTINGNNVTELNDLNNKTDIKELTVPNVGKYVKFDPSKINGQEVDVKLTKVHTQDSAVPSAEKSSNITVRRIPVKTVEKSSIIYKLVDTSGKVTSTVLPEDAIIDRKKNGGINVSFTYPSNTSNEHYGIVHGYKLIIYGYKGAKIFERDYDTTNLTTNMTIDVNSLMWSSANKLRIYAYYKHSSTEYNPEVDNKKYLGPYIEKTFPTVITRLDIPEINYPAEGSSWINNNFRILFQLPNDGDFSLYPDEIADNYIYRDIQLKVTSGNQSVTYSWTSNPLIFSIDKATYKAKVSINPSLMNNFPIGNSYSLKIRVRKNYGYPNANKYAEDSWSDWSLERKFTIKTHSLSVNEGDYIMATDYEKMYNMILAMRNTYPTYNLKCHLVKKGDYILASDFDLVYQDIWSCFNTVNNWGKYGTTKSKVKFNEGRNLPSFSSTVGEYVTDLEDDTSPNGRNYMIKMISDANLLR